jgi:hypothetical protein
VEARSSEWVCCRSLAGIASSNPVGVCMDVSSECCVLSDRAPCDRPITPPEESYECGVSKCDCELDNKEALVTRGRCS